VVKAAIQRIPRCYEIKIKFEDPNALQSLERYTLLGAIDRLCRSISTPSILCVTASICARSGKRIRFIEYKREAYVMFSDLMGRIKAGDRHESFPHQSSITAFESFLRNLPQKFIHEKPPSTLSTRRRDSCSASA